MGIFVAVPQRFYMWVSQHLGSHLGPPIRKTRIFWVYTGVPLLRETTT